ncbi:MAG: hypothetical protein JXR95_02600 [Deltaproteobacteria bacterium]|nr:hypothetical protein [Deltaproteobacteria bacterium]
MACENSDKNTVSFYSTLMSEPADSSDKKPFIHPMIYGLTQHGVVFQDVKDDPIGRRYAITEYSNSGNFDDVESFSGITTIEHEPLTDEDLTLLITKGQRGYSRKYKSAPVISDELQSAFLKNPNDATYLVHVNFDPPPSYKPMTIKLEESMALGEISTMMDYTDMKKYFLEIQREEVAQVSIPIQNFIINSGGLIADTCKNLFCLDAVLTPEQCHELATLNEVSRINQPGKIMENTLDAITIARGTQMETETPGTSFVQFSDNETTAGFLGNRGYPDRIKIGIIEHVSFRDEHPGFEDGSGNSRIELR